MNRARRRMERDIVLGQVSQAVKHLAESARSQYIYLSVWRIRRVMVGYFRFYTRGEAAKKSTRVAWALREILRRTGVPYEIMTTRRGHIYRVPRHELLAALVKYNLIFPRGEAKNA